MKSNRCHCVTRKRNHINGFNEFSLNINHLPSKTDWRQYCGEICVKMNLKKKTIWQFYSIIWTDWINFELAGTFDSIFLHTVNIIAKGNSVKIQKIQAQHKTVHFVKGQLSRILLEFLKFQENFINAKNMVNEQIWGESECERLWSTQFYRWSTLNTSSTKEFWVYTAFYLLLILFFSPRY